jgi:hypothetical protein
LGEEKERKRKRKECKREIAKAKWKVWMLGQLLPVPNK